MPGEVISYFFHHQNLRLRLGFQVVLQCAPFLKGLKVSGLISLEDTLCGGLPGLIGGLDISWKIFWRKQGKCLLFLYRREGLEEYLSRPDIRKVLAGLGYRGMDLEQMLGHLGKRILKLCEGQESFPHEIGAFLGYPAEDIEGFIEHGGKECLFAGYWKVYHDPLGAARTFWKFDRARERAVNEFLAGKSLREIWSEEG